MDTHVLTDKELEALRFLRNQIVHGGQAPSVRDLQKQLKYQSPRAAAYILEKLESKGFIIRNGRGQIRLLKDLRETESHTQTVNVPLVGSAPCGAPVLAEENIDAMIPVSVQLAKRPHRYFLLRATGDSMNKAGIHDSNLVLVRQQQTASNGDIVVALIDGEATIKEFHRQPQAVILKPRSSNPKHKPIILTEDFQVLGVVQRVIDNSTLKL
ncbi:MAG: repressor LexA [candidate division Zixibacteria bacterium]|nr:repressor LexA [candidate division Zixibacteria bacterium]